MEEKILAMTFDEAIEKVAEAFDSWNARERAIWSSCNSPEKLDERSAPILHLKNDVIAAIKERVEDLEESLSDMFNQHGHNWGLSSNKLAVQTLRGSKRGAELVDASIDLQRYRGYEDIHAEEKRLCPKCRSHFPVVFTGELDDNRQLIFEYRCLECKYTEPFESPKKSGEEE